MVKEGVAKAKPEMFEENKNIGGEEVIDNLFSMTTASSNGLLWIAMVCV